MQSWTTINMLPRVLDYFLTANFIDILLYKVFFASEWKSWRAIPVSTFGKVRPGKPIKNIKRGNEIFFEAHWLDHWKELIDNGRSYLTFQINYWWFVWKLVIEAVCEGSVANLFETIG